MFDTVVSGEHTKRGKPDPEPYQLAVKKLEIAPENCCVVENAPLGIKSALAAGLTCFVVKSYPNFPDDALGIQDSRFLFKNLSDLRKILIWVDTNVSLYDFVNTFGRRI